LFIEFIPFLSIDLAGFPPSRESSRLSIRT
jgi:hypothetical protein